MTTDERIDSLEGRVYNNDKYATKGVGAAGVTTGIIGTALGALNALGGNGLKGIIGGIGSGDNGSSAMLGALAGLAGNAVMNNHTPCCSEDHNVNRYEFNMEMQHSREISQKDLEIAALNNEVKLRDANTYTDRKMLEIYSYIDGKLKAVDGAICQQAVQNQANKDSFQIMQERLDCTKSELSRAITQECKERTCADNSIVTYANATFYPKMVANITTGDTTTAQPIYNPLPASTCGCGCGKN